MSKCVQLVQVSASESKHVYACMHVLKAQAATNLQTRLFANIGMLRLTLKFFRCKPPYQFQEEITVGVREQATSEEVAETCAERVLEVSREHGEPFGLERMTLFASESRKLFVLGKASEYFRDGDDVHVCGECVRGNSHGDRDRQDERAAASEPAAAASACESKPGVQRRAEGDRGGRPISARNAVAHLRDAVQDHLSAIFCFQSMALQSDAKRHNAFWTGTRGEISPIRLVGTRVHRRHWQIGTEWVLM